MGFYGKCLLTFTRLEEDDPKKFHWDIDVTLFTGWRDDPGDEILECFSCMKWDCVGAPDIAYKMDIGDRVTLTCNYEVTYSYDEWSGEHDFDMYLISIKVLRYKKYNEREHRKKFYRFWKSSQTDKVTP